LDHFAVLATTQLIHEIFDPREQRIHTNTMLTKLSGGRLGQPDHTELAGRVCSIMRKTAEAGGARNIYDGTPRTGQMGELSSHAEHDSPEIHVEHFIPIFRFLRERVSFGILESEVMHHLSYDRRAGCFAVAPCDASHISSTIQAPEIANCCCNPVFNLVIFAGVDPCCNDLCVIRGA
jgi:hypothetical protein